MVLPAEADQPEDMLGGAPIGQGPGKQPLAASQARSRRLVGSLRHRNFRLLAAGQASTASANWMEQVARGWLIYDMTGSAFLLGLVQALRALPLLFFGPLGGVLADRLDRRLQLMVAQLSNMALNLVLATLIVTGRVEVWHVLTTALLTGCVMAFQQPARQSLIPNTVPRSELMNAVALNSIVMNLAQSIGPAIAGVLVGVSGVAGSYYFQAGLFLVSSVWTFQIRVDDTSRPARHEKVTVWGSFVEGMNYIWANPTVFALLLLALLPIILAQPYSSLLPIFVKDVYGAGPQTLGLLLGVAGLGAAFGALLVAGMGDFRRKGWFLLCVVMALGLSLAGFAAIPWLWLALPLLALVGFAQTSYRVVNQSLLHAHTEDEFRGRVMSIYLLDRGLAPMGSLLAGTLATFLGAPAAVGIMGAATFLAAALVAVRVPRLRGVT